MARPVFRSVTRGPNPKTGPLNAESILASKPNIGERYTIEPSDSRTSVRSFDFVPVATNPLAMASPFTKGHPPI